MDLTQIRYFLSLANTLNFTRASEQCNVTQPALTKSIQRLEAELGGPLLLRERNHTQLTPLGTTMLPLLQQTFDAADNARRAAARFRKQDVARLQIGLGPRVEPDVISPLLLQLSRRFPSLELTLRQGEPRALSEWLLASEIDVTLTETAERLTDRATCWMVFEDPIVVLLPEGHTLAEEAAITPDQLRSCAMIGRVDHDGWDNCGEIDLDALGSLIRHRGSGEAHVHALVRGGQGVALSTASRRLPPCILRRPLRRHAGRAPVAAPGRYFPSSRPRPPLGGGRDRGPGARHAVQGPIRTRHCPIRSGGDVRDYFSSIISDIILPPAIFLSLTMYILPLCSMMIGGSDITIASRVRSSSIFVSVTILWMTLPERV
jgi:DNA-binding transcriptional LysR family regulator